VGGIAFLSGVVCKLVLMRFRVYPTARQSESLFEHCAQARFVWNLAVDQQSNWKVTRSKAPGSNDRFKQLTEARAAFDWLRSGSNVVQQQALRDFDQGMRNFFNRTHGKPTFRSRGRHEGFRIVAVKPEHVRQLSRKWSAIRIPKIGWIRFRRTRALPDGLKSYRVTCDRAGRWHIAFAHKPEPIPEPGNGDVVGVDRGVVHAAVTSDGTMYDLDTSRLEASIRRAQRSLSRCRKRSNRRAKARARLGRLKARQVDVRKDFVEKTTTDIATRFDLVRLEHLQVKNMTATAEGTQKEPGKMVAAKAGLNRAILDRSWGLFANRLEDKASGRVEFVPAAYTSQRCSQCGDVSAKNRKSQAVYACRSCTYVGNADVNAAINIAAGLAVTARGDLGAARSTKREPQPSRLAA